MYGAMRALIKACKHVGYPEQIHLRSKIVAAELELEQLERDSQEELEPIKHEHDFSQGVHCSICGEDIF